MELALVGSRTSFQRRPPAGLDDRYAKGWPGLGLRPAFCCVLQIYSGMCGFYLRVLSSRAPHYGLLRVAFDSALARTESVAGISTQYLIAFKYRGSSESSLRSSCFLGHSECRDVIRCAQCPF